MSQRRKPPCACEADTTTISAAENRVVRNWDRKRRRAFGVRRKRAKRITHTLGDRVFWHWSDQKNLRQPI